MTARHPGQNLARFPFSSSSPPPWPPRPRLLRLRLAEQLGHGHAERAGYLGQGSDRQVLPAALDALEVLEREAEELRLLLLGEPGLDT